MTGPGRRLKDGGALRREKASGDRQFSGVAPFANAAGGKPDTEMIQPQMHTDAHRWPERNHRSRGHRRPARLCGIAAEAPRICVHLCASVVEIPCFPHAMFGAGAARRHAPRSRSPVPLHHTPRRALYQQRQRAGAAAFGHLPQGDRRVPRGMRRVGLCRRRERGHHRAPACHDRAHGATRSPRGPAGHPGRMTTAGGCGYRH